MRKITALISLILLTSCTNSMKRNLGLVREVPDEFKVISQPDLSIPPEFDLVPPAYPIDAYDFNTPPKTSEGAVSVLSDSDMDLIKSLNLPTKELNIRTEIYNGQKHEDYTNNGIVNSVKNIGKKSDSATEVINPVEENKRIQKNLKENKPITEGEVNTYKKDKSTLDKIFGK